MDVLGARTYIRRRYPTLVLDPEGYPYRGIPVESEIRASVQPATGRDLERLPEGQRVGVTMVAFTFDDIRTVDQKIGQQADEIVVAGEIYQVENVQRWNDDWDDDSEIEALLTQAALRRLDPDPEEVAGLDE